MVRFRISNRLVYVLAALAVLVGAGFIYLGINFKSYRIPTGAMAPNLLSGDYLFARRIGSGFQPRVGDILVFKFPEDQRLDYVKRCVALPGDTVAVQDGVLLVNGRVFESAMDLTGADHSCVPGWDEVGDCPPPCTYRDRQAFLKYPRNKEWPWAGQPAPFVVPDGHVFVMGDNRYNSADSRYWGPLDTTLIRGKAAFVYWNPKKLSRIGSKVR